MQEKISLSNVNWVYLSDGSLVLPIIQTYDIIDGRDLKIGLGQDAINLTDSEKYHYCNLQYEDREQAIINKIIKIKGLDQDQVHLDTSFTMLFDILDLDKFMPKSKLTEEIKDFKNWYTIKLMSDFRVSGISAEHLKELPQRNRSSLLAQKYFLQHEFTQNIRLTLEEISLLSENIQAQLQSKHSEQQPPEA